MLGVVIGGRLGYVLFYKPEYYAANLLEVFAVWKGGMAFHGGLLGVIGAVAVFARNRQRHFLEITDLIAPCVPTGLAMGRLGNFINGELWGREAPATMPWGMVFPQSGTDVPRHPSQLYQFALEGMLLFVLLWFFALLVYVLMQLVFVAVVLLVVDAARNLRLIRHRDGP